MPRQVRVHLPYPFTYGIVFLSFFLCFSLHYGVAQVRVRDSLKKELKNLKTGSGSQRQVQEQINLLNALSKKYEYIDADSLSLLAKRALLLSRSIGYPKGESEALQLIGMYYGHEGKTKKAIAYFHEALRIADSINDGNRLAYIYAYMGDEYKDSGNYEKALESYLAGHDIADEIDHKALKCDILGSIALMYGNQREYGEAVKLYHEVIDIYSRIEKEEQMGHALSNLGGVYLQKKDYGNAMTTLDRAMAILEKYDSSSDWLAFVYCLKGESYLGQGKNKWALHWFNKSSLLHRKLDDDRSRVRLVMGYAKAYFNLEDLGKAYDKALDAYKLSIEQQLIKRERLTAQILYEIQKKRGAYEEALKYHEIFQKLSDSLYKDNNRRGLALLKVKSQYNKDKQELIVTNEKALAKQRNFIVISIIILLILLVTTIPLYLNQKKLQRLNGELKRSAENLMKGELKLNAINKTKDKLISIIGHDLRGPIGSLKNLLQLLTNGEISQKEFNALLPRLKCEVEHIFFTLNNLLSWGYTQMNGVQCNPKLVSLNVLASNGINLLGEMAHNKGIKILDQLPKDCFIYADENQLNVVLRNLISNAIKFTPRNGLITLEAEEMDREWVVRVKDSGVGMDKETMDKLFQTDTTVTTYGTNNEKGTGLGLSLCKEMVEKNNGRIWVESTPDKGSTFSFSVPKLTKEYRNAS